MCMDEGDEQGLQPAMVSSILYSFDRIARQLSKVRMVDRILTWLAVPYDRSERQLSKFGMVGCMLTWLALPYDRTQR